MSERCYDKDLYFVFNFSDKDKINDKTKNKIQQANLVKLLWQKKQVKRSRSTFYMPKLFAFFMFRCVKMKNAKAYKPTTMAF